MSCDRRRALQLLAGGAVIYGAMRSPSINAAAAKLKPDAHSALIVVDVQNCFITGGTLAVPHGEEVVAVINRIAPAFTNVILTQDWHPAGHASFASSHPGAKPFEMIQLSYGEQVLWPDHCVQGTADAALAANLKIPQAQLIVRKGFHQDVDSYSAFQEANRTTPTGLKGYAMERGIRTLFVAGLATDFCVAATALDARAAGFETYVVEDACRGIDLKGSVAAAWLKMTAQGVKRIQSADIELAPA
jgi:nicotinamidase/pyrazinamidase